MNNSWEEYQSIRKPPNTFLLNFLKNVPKAQFSSIIDLGCGAMQDTEYLLKQGYPVAAIDANLNEKRRDEVLNNLTPEQKGNAHFERQFLENLNLPKTDFLFSFSTLPFCSKEGFASSIINIAQSINPNGYFLGTFFAPGNMLAGDGKYAREFDKTQIETLFNYLGFKSSVTEYNSEHTANGSVPDPNHNLTSILVSAQAPEQLPEITEEKINQILGLTLDQNKIQPTTEAPSTVFEGYLKYKNEETPQEPLPEAPLDSCAVDNSFEQ